MASPPVRAPPPGAPSSVDALKRLRKLETDGAARLAQLQFEGTRTLASLAEEAEESVSQARAQAEREAEQLLAKAQETAEAEAAEIVQRGEEEAERVGATKPAHLPERRSGDPRCRDRRVPRRKRALGGVTWDSSGRSRWPRSASSA